MISQVLLKGKQTETFTNTTAFLPKCTMHLPNFAFSKKKKCTTICTLKTQQTQPNQELHRKAFSLERHKHHRTDVSHIACYTNGRRCSSTAINMGQLYKPKLIIKQ